MIPKKPVPDVIRDGHRFSGEIMPCNKSGDESPIVIFYRSYVTLRSIRGSSTAKLPGKPGFKVIAACFSTALPGYRAEKCLRGRQNILHDHIDALRGRMHSIRLVEPGIRRNAIQEKRI